MLTITTTITNNYNYEIRKNFKNLQKFQISKKIKKVLTLEIRL